MDFYRDTLEGGLFKIPDGRLVPICRVFDLNLVLPRPSVRYLRSVQIQTDLDREYLIRSGTDIYFHPAQRFLDPTRLILCKEKAEHRPVLI
jgi:hypothetical protein